MARWPLQIPHFNFLDCFIYRHGVSAATFITVGVLTQGQQTPGYHNSRVTVFEHPNYDDNTIDNDIALLKLEVPIMAYSDYVRPVCMSKTLQEYSTYSSQPCYVIGWGALSSGGQYTILSLPSPSP